MRVPAALVLVLAFATSASAEPCGPGGPVFALVPGTVKITLRAGRTLEATLVCVDRNTLVIVEGAGVRQVPLRDVVRIVKPRDSVLNGALIGAGVGLVLGIVTYGGEASYRDSEDSYILKAALTLGALGAGIDAIRGSNWIVYSAPADRRTAGVAWRMRF